MSASPLDPPCFAAGIVVPLSFKRNACLGITFLLLVAGLILQYKADIIHSQAAASANRRMQKRLEAQADELDRQARQWWERVVGKDDRNVKRARWQVI